MNISKKFIPISRYALCLATQDAVEQEPVPDMQPFQLHDMLLVLVPGLTFISYNNNSIMIIGKYLKGSSFRRFAPFLGLSIILLDSHLQRLIDCV